MGSLNSPGSIDVVGKQNANFRNEGGSIVVTSGLFPQRGPTSSKVSTTHVPQGLNRSVAEFGTQPDRGVSQYSALCISPAKKITTSNDASLDVGLVSRTTNTVVPDSGNQPEIANKPVSQRSTYHLGGRVVVRNSDNDGLVGRNSNQGFIPGP